MSTTIQVSRRTLQLLSMLKKKMKAQSYDELLLKLAMEKLNLPQSMFGSNPKLASFTEEEEAEFHEL
ncbi:MAG: hypothetical protein J7L98_03665 [Candidatus Verstraetearchaeota archaeon]|nr:hypothetical protein [Candidatus Verstraetearchaeota archaeon]